MPMVGDKKFPYTPAGKKAAKMEAIKSGKKKVKKTAKKKAVKRGMFGGM